LSYGGQAAPGDDLSVEIVVTGLDPVIHLLSKEACYED
jgi:hypothetical protein